MQRIGIVALAAALLLTMSVGAASAAPTNARNYDEIDLECEGLGDITIGFASLGEWAAARVIGTQLTLVPRWFEFTAIYYGPDGESEGEVVFGPDREAKRNANVDDVCSFGGTFYLEDDPDGFPDGYYAFEGLVGVRVVGRR
jgi:hypothetical protein